jgi:hypothetical protein
MSSESCVPTAQCSGKFIVRSLPSRHSSRSVDPNPRNEVSSGLDGTDLDTKYDRLPSGHSPRSADPITRSDDLSGLDGTDRNTKDEKILG